MAINSSELRIGNWVLDPAYGLPMELDIDNMEVLLGSRHFDGIDPIPLTTEILKKAGFVIEDGSESEQYALMVDNFLTIKIHKDDFSWAFSGLKESVTPSCGWFKYVHQLQNLYFALTNQELPINNLP